MIIEIFESSRVADGRKFYHNARKAVKNFLQISLKNFMQPFTCNCLPFTDECKFLNVQTTKWGII